MFKVGDKVVCIDDYNGFDHKFKPSEYLVKNQTYTIQMVRKYYDNYNVRLKEISEFNFGAYRFVLLSEFRKQKIRRICSKLETD